MNTIEKNYNNPIKKNIDYLEGLGYIVLTKLELNEIVKKSKLGKIPVLDRRGKIVGWRE